MSLHGFVSEHIFVSVHVQFVNNFNLKIQNLNIKIHNSNQNFQNTESKFKIENKSSKNEFIIQNSIFEIRNSKFKIQNIVKFRFFLNLNFAFGKQKSKNLFSISFKIELLSQILENKINEFKLKFKVYKVFL